MENDLIHGFKIVSACAWNFRCDALQFHHFKWISYVCIINFIFYTHFSRLKDDSLDKTIQSLQTDVNWKNFEEKKTIEKCSRFYETKKNGFGFFFISKLPNVRCPKFLSYLICDILIFFFNKKAYPKLLGTIYMFLLQTEAQSVM